MADKREIKVSQMVKRAIGKSSLGVNNFKKRVFVLTQNKLSYYDGTAEKRGPLKGEILLANIRGIENVAGGAFDKPSFQIIHGENPVLILYVLANDATQQREWVDILRGMCKVNMSLADMYHPGIQQSGKWACCNKSKQDEGCKPTYYKSPIAQLDNQSAYNTPNAGESGSGSGAIKYTTTLDYKAKLNMTKEPTSPNSYFSNSPQNGPSTRSYASNPKPYVAPRPEPAHDDFEVIAMYDYTPSDQVDLPLQKGQKVTIINSSRPHWWKAKNNYGQEGYVPSNYVKKIGLETEDWYFQDLSRTQAEEILLEEKKEGGFVVRPSGRASSNYKYALSICHENQVRHYHIKQDDKNSYYISDKHRFNTVSELVNYHKSNGGGLVTRLRRPPTQLVPNQPSLSSLFGDKYEIDKVDLNLGKELGSGQFGRVMKGVWKGTVEVAIKMMKEGTMNEDDFVQEAEVMIKFQHPNLVHFYGICTMQGPIYIVTELLEHGNLLTYIRQRRDFVNKTDVLIDMNTQICSAMKYLEECHFIHRDLAARNCLVGKRNIVKVGDFGLARHVMDDEYTASEGTKFPIKWAAPEVISHARFSSKSDVWSFGILLWEIFSGGKTPYPTFSNPQVFEEVLKGYRLPQPQACPNPVYEVMRDCWLHTSEDRPSFTSLHKKLTALTEHDYFDADDFSKVGR